MSIGYNRRARGTVRDRMDAQTAMDFIQPLLENATPQQMVTRKYRKLRIMYAFCMTYHLPASQAKPHLSVANRNPMNVNRWEVDQFKTLFIFTQAELQRVYEFVSPLLTDHDELGAELGYIKASNGVKVDTFTAFAALLNRLRSRDKLEMTCSLFGEQIPTFSSVCVIALRRLYPELEPYFDFGIIRAEPQLMEDYIQAIDNKLDDEQYADHRVFALIDGSCWPIARPTYGQQSAYNGHHRVHALQHLAVRAPDGLCIFLSASIEGRRHDAGIAQEINLHEVLTELCRLIELIGRLYGDSAFYGLSPLILHAFKDTPNTTEPEREETAAFIPVRVPMEWFFGEVYAESPGLRQKDLLKIFGSPLAHMYRFAAWIHNCVQCSRGSNTSVYFKLKPPLLDEYLTIFD